MGKFEIPYMTTEEFGAYPLVVKLAYVYMSGLVVRLFFYASFRFLEAGNVACGLQYNGKDEKTGKTKAEYQA